MCTYLQGLAEAQTLLTHLRSNEDDVPVDRALHTLDAALAHLKDNEALLTTAEQRDMADADSSADDMNLNLLNAILANLSCALDALPEQPE